MSSTDKKDKSVIADKVRKLLKIVECETATDAEKQTALHQASRLSQKHAIDMDALGDEASEFGVTVLDTFGSRNPSWALPVAHILTDYFNVRCFKRNGMVCDMIVAHEWACFGCKPSRDVATYVWVFLKREFLRLAKICRPLDRHSFFTSVACGLAVSLRDKQQKSEPEMTAGLIRIGDSLEKEFEKTFQDLKEIKEPTLRPNHRAFHMGRQISVHQAIHGDHEAQSRLA